MSDWKEYRLGDCIEFIIDNRGKNPPLSDSGYELIETNMISSNNKYPDFDKVTKYVSEDTYNNWFRKGHPKIGDILISTVGNIGKVAIVNEDKGCIAQNLIGLRVNEKIIAEYLYYFLIKKDTQDQLLSLNIGSVQPSIKVPHLLNLEIKIPELLKQKECIQVLSKLDDKIQLNTQINQTLEQIAQALFKSWFVDFDPVRAKVQALSDDLSLEQAELAAMQAISGKTAEELTALSQTQPDRYAELAETAKAFPCEMVEVDGVEVPKGWDTLSFKDFIKEKKEKVGNLKNVPEYSVTNNGIIPRSQKFNKQLSKDPEKNKLLHKTDLVFGISREVLNWGIMEDEIGAVSSAYHIYSINKDKVNYLYLKMLMQNRFEYFNELIRPSSREGQGFDKELLKEKKVTIPCNILLDKFLHDLNTIKSQMNNITQETESLIFIRNLLLPKLLNGEI